jgi:hypothetical protein
MIRPCRCNGVPDLLRVPSPSSCGWVLNLRVRPTLILTLRFERCSSCHVGPWSEGFNRCYHWNVAAVDTTQHSTTLHHYLESRCSRTQTSRNNTFTRKSKTNACSSKCRLQTVNHQNLSSHCSSLKRVIQSF